MSVDLQQAPGAAAAHSRRLRPSTDCNRHRGCVREQFNGERFDPQDRGYGPSGSCGGGNLCRAFPQRAALGLTPG
jgi:hypothetical protein